MNMGEQNNGPTDRELEQLDQAYRELGPDEPPGLVDQAVLNRARAAVEQPRRAWSWNLSWAHTLGTAAGVLLVVSVFIQMRSEAPKVAVPVTSPASEAIQFQAEPARAAGPESTGSLEADAVDGLSAGRDDDAAQNVPREETLQRKAQAAERRTMNFDTPLQQEAQVRASADQEVDAGFADHAEAEPEDSAAAATVGEALIVDEATEDLREGNESFKARDLATEKAEREAQQLGAPAPEMKRLAEDAVRKEAEKPTLEAMSSELLSPEAWLAQVLELKAAGEDDAVRLELEAFQAAYPDYELPLELRD